MPIVVVVVVAVEERSEGRLAPVGPPRPRARRRAVAVVAPLLELLLALAHHAAHALAGLLHLGPEAADLALDRVVLGEEALEVAHLADVALERLLRLAELLLQRRDRLGVRVGVGVGAAPGRERRGRGRAWAAGVVRRERRGRAAAERVVHDVERRVDVAEVDARVARFLELALRAWDAAKVSVCALRIAHDETESEGSTRRTCSLLNTCSKLSPFCAAGALGARWPRAPMFCCCSPAERYQLLISRLEAMASSALRTRCTLAATLWCTIVLVSSVRMSMPNSCGRAGGAGRGAGQRGAPKGGG